MELQRELKKGGGGGGGGVGRPKPIGGPRPFIASPYIYHTGRRRGETPKCLLQQDTIIEAIGTPGEYWGLENFTWGNTSECVEVPDYTVDILCNYTNTTLMDNVRTSCESAGGKIDLVQLYFACPNSTNSSFIMSARLSYLPFCQAQTCDTYLHTDYINSNSTAFWGDNITAVDCNYTLYWSGGTHLTAAYGTGMVAFFAYLISLFL